MTFRLTVGRVPLVEEKGFPNAFERGISSPSATDTRYIVTPMKFPICVYLAIRGNVKNKLLILITSLTTLH